MTEGNALRAFRAALDLCERLDARFREGGHNPRNGHVFEALERLLGALIELMDEDSQRATLKTLADYYAGHRPRPDADYLDEVERHEPLE